ncbi:MAG: bifunctional diaminohydroxyphosphoribosylaminopyrimidine deaminase/5-amino-6-(5-phosphoribosylamino)uracil reductase RibD [Planctomycetota bacterium]
MNTLQALARACALARRGLFEVEPNPPVGAVVLAGPGPDEGAVLGEGWHRAWGGAHAEVHALREAGSRARGATLCVTLEPCSTMGKTPPCTRAVLEAGIARVVVGSADPHPLHQGQGLELLLAAGVHIDLVDLPEAQALLARFRAGFTRRRPHVLAKWAMSRDGGLAPASGARAVLSSAESHALLHQWRAHLDAIVVGVNTVSADDPLLTARGPESPVRPLRRVVLDPSLRTPLTARLLATAGETPTWIYAMDGASRHQEERLVAAGARVVRIPREPDWLQGVFADLHLGGVGRCMVEGGAHTLNRCLAADVVDQVAIFIAPRELGPGALPAPFPAPPGGSAPGSLSPDEIVRALGLSECRISRSGVDTLVRGYRG